MLSAVAPQAAFESDPTLDRLFERLLNSQAGFLEVDIASIVEPGQVFRVSITLLHGENATTDQTTPKQTTPTTKLAWQHSQRPLSDTALIQSSLRQRHSSRTIDPTPTAPHLPQPAEPAPSPMGQSNAEGEEEGLGDDDLLDLPTDHEHIPRSQLSSVEVPLSMAQAGASTTPSASPTDMAVDPASASASSPPGVSVEHQGSGTDLPNPAPSLKWVRKYANLKVDKKYQLRWEAKQRQQQRQSIDPPPSLSSDETGDETDEVNLPLQRARTGRLSAAAKSSRRNSVQRSATFAGVRKQRHARSKRIVSSQAERDESAATTQHNTDSEVDEPSTSSPATTSLDRLGEGSEAPPSTAQLGPTKQTNDRSRGEEWLWLKLAKLGPVTCQQTAKNAALVSMMVRAALAMGGFDSIERWQAIYFQWRQDSDPAVESQTNQARVSTVPDHLLGLSRSVHALWDAFRAHERSEAKGFVQDIAHRVTLANLYERYEAAVDRLAEINARNPDLTATKVVGHDRRSREKRNLFWALYHHLGRIEGDPKVHPKTRSHYQKLHNKLTYGKKWSTIKQALGLGCLSLIPSCASNRFFERRMDNEHLALWTSLVQQFNPKAIELGRAVLQSLERAMSGGNQPIGRVLRIECESLAALSSITDPTLLFHDADEAMVSGVSEPGSPHALHGSTHIERRLTFDDNLFWQGLEFDFGSGIHLPLVMEDMDMGMPVPYQQ